jgi:hypothetical protein
MSALDRGGLLAGLAAMALLAAGLVLGSRNLRNYDPVLLTYSFGVLFSAFGVAYRFAVWLRRPPTRLLVRRGLRLLRGGRVAAAARAAAVNLGAHRFIRARGFGRWLAHFLIAWGSLLAGAVTFPLVFGWLHFDTLPENPGVYVIRLFDVAVGRFDADSPMRFVMFNLLNLSAVMVIVGASLALRRRLRDPGTLARQQFGNDLLPLFLLLAISFTGLLLTFSMHALHGAGYREISLLHAFTVVAALLYVPYGKFFHVVQRPLHIASILHRTEAESGPRAACRRCGAAFAGVGQLEDLKAALGESGFTLDLDLCPRCKRVSPAIAQAKALAEARLTEARGG